MNGNSIHLLFGKALEFEKKGEFMMALQEYANLAHGTPPYRPALINLGALYSRMNRFDDAMLCYQNAISIEDDSLAWFNIGSLHYKRCEYKKAVIACERARRLDALFVLPILVMGLSFSHLKNFKAAEKSFVDVLSLSPVNEVALTALTILYYEKGRHHQALEMADRLLSTYPTKDRVRNLRSKILFNLGRMMETAEEIKRVKETDERYTVYTQFVESVPVEVYDDRYGSIEDKIQLLEEKTSEESRPGDMIALSLCYLFKGDADHAIDCLLKTRE